MFAFLCKEFTRGACSTSETGRAVYIHPDQSYWQPARPRQHRKLLPRYWIDEGDGKRQHKYAQTHKFNKTVGTRHKHSLYCAPTQERKHIRHERNMEFEFLESYRHQNENGSFNDISVLSLIMRRKFWYKHGCSDNNFQWRQSQVGDRLHELRIQ